MNKNVGWYNICNADSRLGLPNWYTQNNIGENVTLFSKD